jgi:hypothetical protein
VIKKQRYESTNQTNELRSRLSLFLQPPVPRSLLSVSNLSCFSDIVLIVPFFSRLWHKLNFVSIYGNRFPKSLERKAGQSGSSPRCFFETAPTRQSLLPATPACAPGLIRRPSVQSTASIPRDSLNQSPSSGWFSLCSPSPHPLSGFWPISSVRSFRSNNASRIFWSLFFSR